MNPNWAVHIPSTDATGLARLQGRLGLEVCFQGDSVWLCGRDVDEDLEKKLRALRGTRYEVLADRQLVPSGCLVPCGYLPDGSWIALRDALSIQIEPPALGAQIAGQVRLQVVRGGPVREANLLLATLEAWVEYAGTAPQVRLERLAFAAGERGEVLVRGTPLPPVPGRHFVEDNGLAVPAGWTWSPQVDPEALRVLFQLDRHDIALLHEDGTWDRVRADDFVRATRSAARLSLEGAIHA